MENLAYVNGEFMELRQAKISIEDRGFQFGDGIYEVIKLYQGRLFKLEEHLERLLTSATSINLNLDYTVNELKELCQEVLSCNRTNPRSKSGSLYLQVTRGEAPRSHSYHDGIETTLIAYLLPAKSISNQLREKGVSVITIPDKRWGYCNIKTINLLPNILGKQQAKKAGVYEAVFVDDNKVTEGTSSNIFIVKNGMILTHPANENILGGITRQVVLKLARNRFKVKEKPFTACDLYQAEEVFITSTTKEVLGVTKVDDKEINGGQIGRVTTKLHKDYKEYIAKFKKN
ncbi:D-amino acid aminotransferase [Halobacteroides halobius DSM 5150]|uniref:D-alanine aminotransferase n=1 Tax=Halobacteroides halobius (strain ATCC 35273 / DSM 5150 / MD-1) TaxID=748449 RepID=L0K7P3_HALHC|nr:D-amino-acid transaminase [Halobacteroides halobius]AGB40364.1 D-amino acid aminotransferase [Halobacteroides halobius DSM 5150]